MTGLPINPYFSAYKFAWLLENVPEAKAAVDDGTALFGTIDTYLIWRLTGGGAAVTASRHNGVVPAPFAIILPEILRTVHGQLRAE